MPKTNANYQREHRQRQAHRLDALEEANAELQGELDATRADLDAAHAEVERLLASQCRHPAAAVDSGVCGACGSDVW
jgi:hypothetical protein